MPLKRDRKFVIRVAGCVLAATGAAAAAAAVARFILSVKHNDVEGAPMLTQFAEYYVRIGTYYSRGFATGFFLCWSLVLLAVIVSGWAREILESRRAPQR